ncbi:hypothetical protein [Roseovarius indicus]|uniref:Uncharacterized protein n=1 Tax=Roseovarius indicus TaxID=540747 RepID=A0A0T5P7I6_9RHOB|nr:hypothetical protein [Roseovarius indicus]KRS16911.1 hypothetical protein XM52_15085 [Roseovarius indicus]QEW29552.1 hypothetical protein RIdsm_05397 [Roseovarius indicus]SFE47791.1 hypothetical protein SAMN04488031_110185 [Roseovarius indicus]
MFNLKTCELPVNPALEDCFLNLLLEALEDKGLVPEETPDIGYGDSYVRENLSHLTVEKVPGGWVWNILFKPRSGYDNDCMTAPMFKPFQSAAEALVFGASTVCEIVTGSSELPFTVAGNMLVMASYGDAT